MAPQVPQLALREEKRHLAGGGLRGVGGVDRVPLLGLGVELPHRAGLRFGGVGRADHLPQARDGVVPLERESQTGPRRHEGYQGAVKGDRKSTRLNSSHLVISYAVFCLKKKKNTQTPS